MANTKEKNTYFEPLPLDTSEAVSFDNSPVPDGDYELQLVNARGGKSGAGNPKIDWEFKVVENDAFNEKRIFHTTVTTGKGAGMFQAVIEALGYDFEEWQAAAGGQVTYEAIASLFGERATAKVKTDEPTAETLAKYPNAKPRNKISRFN